LRKDLALKNTLFAGLSITVALLGTTAHAAAGRLPTGVVPTAYDLTIAPDAAKLSFTGSGTVAITIAKPTRTITVNAADLSVRDVKIDGRLPATVKLDPAGQTATFTFAKPVTAGNHRLSMAWTGKIYQSATGLFAIDYTNSDGSKDRMLATQFEAPDARRFAPMWDEPALKATFKLSAVAPKGQMAFSNMPVTGQTPAANGKVTWHFAPTPKMSSYLMYLGIGNVERKTVMAGNVEIGVITRKGVVDQGDYALASAKRILTHYNDYFGTPYPLPKMDMIAGPGSSQFFGAMENWGAIFYFERVLLQDPKLATESQKQDIFNVVAHEMAHQWFGDLVTMSWWDDLWLNEGFASWMASKTANDLNPEWGALTQTMAFDRQGAMSRDARVTTHPIIQHVETPDQISQAFDDITYRKGEAVIRMLEGAVGPDAFRTGVQRYMAKYKYGNTVTDQLWAEVAAASGKPVKPMMDSFTLQGGVPLIKVGDPVCANGSTSVAWTQGRFSLDAGSKKPQNWIVPVSIGQAGGAAPTRVIAPGSATVPSRATVPGCGLTVANFGQSAYFRTLYTPTHLDKLQTGFSTLSVDDQVGLVADGFGLANSGDQPVERYLSLISGVSPDASPILWSLITNQLQSVDGTLTDAPEQAAFRLRARRLLAPQLARTGWTAKSGEASALATLRERLIPALGTFGEEAVVTEGNRYAQASFETPDAIPGYIRQPALRIFAYTADAARWDKLRERARDEKSPVARLNLYTGLGSTRDPALAQKALDLTLTDEIPVPMRGNVIQAVAREHPARAFDWAVAHEAEVNAFLETTTRAAFIVGLPAGSSDPAVATRVAAYAAKALPAGSRKPAEVTAAVINYRAGLRQRQAPAIALWASK
jgi:aminopeptidase N